MRKVVVGDDMYAEALTRFLAGNGNGETVLVSPHSSDLLEILESAGWVIEAAGQDLELKRRVLASCEVANCPIVTSDSSIIPRAELISGFSAAFQRRHAVTHFFFPLKHCTLVELVATSGGSIPMSEEIAQVVVGCLTSAYGRKVVEVSDSPGFCANRVGLFTIAAALCLAHQTGTDRSAIDKAAIPTLGLPRSGLFNTAELIGLSTLNALLSALAQRLPEGDALHDYASVAIEAIGQPSPASVPNCAPEDIVVILADIRDRYMQAVAVQNSLDMTTLREIMKQSYGWGA
jgi:3-hydroxyacyl-CoA dehydrogenase